jgi:acyl-CoA hydrolase
METIDITPTWETAVKIYIAVLENENASAESKHNARAELTFLAKTVDRLQAVKKAEAKHNDDNFEIITNGDKKLKEMLDRSN